MNLYDDAMARLCRHCGEPLEDDQEKTHPECEAVYEADMDRVWGQQDAPGSEEPGAS